MSNGALLQLVAIGLQDNHFLTGNPNITFFKAVFKKYTNFSIESRKLQIDGTLNQQECSISSTISRSGDLLSNITVDVNLKATTNGSNGTYTNWCNNTGAAYIKDATIKIGGSIIDRHDSYWIDIYNELTDKDEYEHILLNKHKSLSYRKNSDVNNCPNLEMSIPLKFWFNNKSTALPLVALQYHDVKLELTLRALTNLVISDEADSNLTFADPEVSIWAEYIFLDKEERKRFANDSHEYLIQQLQYVTEDVANTIEINFNHPVKEIIWVFTNSTRTSEIDIKANKADPASFDNKTLSNDGNSILSQGTETIGGNDYFNYSPVAATSSFIEASKSGSSMFNGNYNEHFDTFTLELNGHDRFEKRKAVYFRNSQPYLCGHKKPDKYIYMYSFSLDCSSYQPMGSCNFSRIDSAKMKFNDIGSVDNREIKIYVINYNILRIKGGMGGLAYSN